MKLGLLSASDVSRRLGGAGLALRTGPFQVRLKSQLPAVHSAVTRLYAAHAVLDDNAYCDVTLDLRGSRGWRRWLRPQVRVLCEGRPPFEPLPSDQAYALLEWTLNWWIAGHAHQYLLLHAAVVARGNDAAILPAPPGSGKSTLCAALVNRGWRLLSDEMALVSLADGSLHPLVRPISLKNQSLQVIGDFVPDAIFSDAASHTSKGTIAHLKPLPEHVAAMDVPARPRWVVFPRYVAGAAALLTPRDQAGAMMELGHNAFNYALLGRAGFDALGDLVSACGCHDFSYSRLDDAIAVFDGLR